MYFGAISIRNTGAVNLLDCHCLKPKSCAICNVLKRENTMFFCPCLPDLRVNVMRIFVTIWTLNPCKGRGIKTFRKKRCSGLCPKVFLLHDALIFQLSNPLLCKNYYVYYILSYKYDITGIFFIGFLFLNFKSVILGFYRYQISKRIIIKCNSILLHFRILIQFSPQF